MDSLHSVPRHLCSSSNLTDGEQEQAGQRDPKQTPTAKVGDTEGWEGAGAEFPQPAHSQSEVQVGREGHAERALKPVMREEALSRENLNGEKWCYWTLWPGWGRAPP